MDNQYTIMFADVAGSTSMYDTLGDTEAEKQIAGCMCTLTEITHKHNGTLIKTIGDEIMASFTSANDAIEAAIDMQHNISGENSNKLSIRIGLQYGNAIERDGDLYGDAVNVAARMAGIAKGMQIITTEDLVEQLNPELKEKSRLFDRTRVKGKEGELRVYQVNWEEEAKVTLMATSHEMQKISAANHAIVLKVMGTEKIYTDADLATSVTIGKDPSCDITVNAQYASRSHVNLQYRRGKFILIDHSTNGTYVKFTDSDEIFIRREELTLLGDGIFSLGETSGPALSTAISFNILQPK